MQRREFVAGLGSAAAWPLAARAQQGERVRRVGVLMVGNENVPVIKTWVSAFTQALAGLGCIDGRKTLMGGACAKALWLVAKEGLVPIRGQSPTLASAQKIAGSSLCGENAYVVVCSTCFGIDIAE